MTEHGVPEKAKKVNSLHYFIALLSAKRLDKVKLKDHFLDNFACVPQEHRLMFWKRLLGMSSSFHAQYTSSDSILIEHYKYLKRVIQDVLACDSRCASDNEILNLYIYLLDKNQLPLDLPLEFQIVHPFCLIYRQVADILDDSIDDSFECECYYLSAELFEMLQKNLDSMTTKFYETFPVETTKVFFTQPEVERLLSSGLAYLFRDIKMYHVMWDKLVTGETDILVCILISLIETSKEEQLKHFKNHSLPKNVSLDETKILKNSLKYYKKAHSNSQLKNSILSYFNSK